MKKHVLKTALVLLLVLTMVVPSISVMALEGDTNPSLAEQLENTEATSYTIYDRDDLAYFMTLENDFSGKTVYLGANIDWNDVDTLDEVKNLTDPEKWTPYAATFKGTFDGQGYTINGIYIKELETQYYIGFFGRINKATIKNVSFDNGYLYTGATAGRMIGFVAGDAGNQNTFENVSVNAYQEHTSTRTDSRIGGMIGYLSSASTSTFTNCVVNGELKAASAAVVGGFVGANYLTLNEAGTAVNTGTLTMTDCINYADVACKYQGAGLIGGLSGKGNFTRCMSFGKITAETTTVDGVNLNVTTASLVYARYKSYNGTTPSTPTADGDVKSIITFTNSYDVAYSATYPIVIHRGETGFKVNFTGGSVGTRSAYFRNNSAETNVRDALKLKTDGTSTTDYGKGCSFKGQGWVISFDKATTTALKLLGVQTRATKDNIATEGDESAGNFDARFVSSIAFDEMVTADNIKEIGFEARALSAYLADANKAVTPVACDAVYTSIKTDYDTAEITAASKGAKYLATLVLNACPSGAGDDDKTNDVQTILIRSYCKDNEGNTYYSAYSVFTFINGSFAGSAAVN